MHNSSDINMTLTDLALTHVKVCSGNFRRFYLIFSFFSKFNNMRKIFTLQSAIDAGFLFDNMLSMDSPLNRDWFAIVQHEFGWQMVYSWKIHGIFEKEKKILIRWRFPFRLQIYRYRQLTSRNGRGLRQICKVGETSQKCYPRRNDWALRELWPSARTILTAHFYRQIMSS